MNTEPVSYDSLKTVLQYMEANLRIQLTTHIPSIRTAEKSVPLKINSLTFDGMKIVVNKIEYNIGIHRKDHDDNAYVPNDIQLDNDNGGAQHNFNQYGLPDLSSDDIITPGDVNIGKSLAEGQIAVPRINELEMQNLEMEAERLKGILAQGRLQGGKFVKTEDHFYRLVSSVERDLRDINYRLVPYHCWRDDRQPPFDMFFQLAITSTSGKQIQWIKYSRRLHEAQKHLNTCLFGKRLFPIQVKWLNIDDSVYGKILRLPLGLKLKIQKLKICSKVAEVYEALKPILEPSTLPLNCLHIVTMQHNYEDFKHVIVTSAEKLVIRNNGLPTWRTIVQSLSNQRVHLNTRYWNLIDYISLVHNWLDTGRPVNTYFSFEIEGNEDEMTKLLQSIKQRFYGTISGERCVTLRMDVYLDLKIFYKPEPYPYVHCDKPQWILKMKVVQNEVE